MKCISRENILAWWKWSFVPVWAPVSCELSQIGSFVLVGDDCFSSVFADGGITITAPPVLCSRWIHATQLWERCTCDTHYIISWNMCQAVHSCCFCAACDSCPPLYLVVFPRFVSTAPEVLSGGPYNHAADWWSLGIMLFSLVTGEVKANEYVNVSITGRTDLCTHTSEHFWIHLVSSTCRAGPQRHVEEGQRVSLHPAHCIQLCTDRTAHPGL